MTSSVAACHHCLFMRPILCTVCVHYVLQNILYEIFAPISNVLVKSCFAYCVSCFTVMYVYYTWLVEITVGSRDVAFVSFPASLCTTFLNTGDRGEGRGMCENCGSGESKGLLPVKYCHSSTPFCVSQILHGGHRTVIGMSIWPLSVLGILPDFSQWCLVLLYV